ncbi:MAG: hypothetical protein QOI36_4355 [Pseudonocardiales bacterium]|nr:hypothetical protein [Pseudonocardiales bacterium]
MLELARDRASGAYPYLVTPDYVASAREILGAEPQLAVLLDVVPETDPGRAPEIVRGGSLQFLATLPGYAANFRRMGFVDDDISGLSDRLVDALTVWGDFDTIARRITEYRTAGADQVVVQLEGLPNEWWGSSPKPCAGVVVPEVAAQCRLAVGVGGEVPPAPASGQHPHGEVGDGVEAVVPVR